jgi:hypothetical protein
VASGASGSPGSGGFNAVLAGGALLVMATFVPFAILRLIPAIEAGAIGHLEGLRQRGSAAVTGPLGTAAGFALHSGLQSDGAARLMGMTAAGGALGGVGGGGTDASGGSGASAGLEAKAVSTDPDDGGLFATRGAEQYDELMASGGLEPRPKGPKPIVGWNEASESHGDAGSRDGDGGGGGGGAGPAPATPTDAWKWKGVPPGRSFLYPVEPGKHRFYIDYDAQGPKMVGLPPAWPTDAAEGDEGGDT